MAEGSSNSNRVDLNLSRPSVTDGREAQLFVAAKSSPNGDAMMSSGSAVGFVQKPFLQQDLTGTHLRGKWLLVCG